MYFHFLVELAVICYPLLILFLMKLLILNLIIMRIYLSRLIFNFSLLGVFLKVETFERQNRNLDIREGRKHTAEYELKGHRRESSGNNDSPSREYN